MPRACIATAAALGLGLLGAGCKRDAPEQDRDEALAYDPSAFVASPGDSALAIELR